MEQTPRDEAYEDYICAYLQSGGLYVEKSIIYREEAELLELDIISTDFTNTGSSVLLLEIKSGNWGFSDVFKVKGWMDFLGMTNGAFIVRQSRDHMQYYIDKASELSIRLICNDNLENTQTALNAIAANPSDANVIQTLRFSYKLERKIHSIIKQKKREFPDVRSYRDLSNYLFMLNSSSFFTKSPLERINRLFRAYLDHKNISSKLADELSNGVYNEEIVELSSQTYSAVFYQCTNDNIYPALYVEHQARLTILKCCIEYLVNAGTLNVDAFIEALNFQGLPNNIKTGLEVIVTDTHFRRYPMFWQFFTYVMGGFVLTDFENEEYEYMSEHTGVPVDQIPNAFDAFNKLFPTNNGWMHNFPKSNISWHKFFPLPLSGIGANHRRIIHSEIQEYDDLFLKIKGVHTKTDLIKWNNIGHRMLL